MVHKTDQLRSFRVEELSRVEGEGALDVLLDGDEIVDLKFKIFESPRFYEAFLRGRDHTEAPDITARICGICPVAYQTSSINAMEQILGIDVGERITVLRRLLYLAEWIESHALHIYLLHAPDFLGYPSGVAMAAEFPNEVRDALRLKKIGNDLMALIGGREVHPINPKVGGFHRAPLAAELASMTKELQWALEASLRTVALVSTFPFPDLDLEYEFVALTDPEEYAIIGGRIRSSEGIDASVDEFNDVFVEEHVEWSNALHARVRDRGAYHVGPMARFNLNRDQLHPIALEAARQIEPRVVNPFRSIIVRAIEVVHACATSLDIIGRYERPTEPAVTAPVRMGEGHGASEAPRGMLYHRYRIDDLGLITEAQIVPPTSQNQLRIEEDLRRLIPTIVELTDEEIRHRLEQAIRNYDPCISCATHFLDLRIRRS
jgi:coenzyme F420-reducing hydrogenase alpha subunit